MRLEEPTFSIRALKRGKSLKQKEQFFLHNFRPTNYKDEYRDWLSKIFPQKVIPRTWLFFRFALIQYWWVIAFDKGSLSSGLSWSDSCLRERSHPTLSFDLPQSKRESWLSAMAVFLSDYTSGDCWWDLWLQVKSQTPKEPALAQFFWTFAAGLKIRMVVCRLGTRSKERRCTSDQHAHRKLETPPFLEVNNLVYHTWFSVEMKEHGPTNQNLLISHYLKKKD